MIYLNVLTSVIQAPEYVGSEPTDRATWWNLSLYCAAQENGGTIAGCGDWKDRRWQQTCAVTLFEVKQECALWKWDGDTLTVWGYPVDKEQLVKMKREAGRAGGKVKSDAKTEAAKLNGSKGGRPETQAETEAETQAEVAENPSTNPSKSTEKPNGMEGKGREYNTEREREGGIRRPTLIQAKSAAASIGVTEAKAEEWWHARESTDWMKGTIGGGTIAVGHNWQSDLKTYSTRNGLNGGNGNGHRQEKASREYPEPQPQQRRLPRL
jgi:hypothetical protein